MSTLIVYAGNTLKREDYMNDGMRAEKLRTVEQIVVGKHIAGIRIDARLDATCCLFVRGSEEGLRALQTALEDDTIDSKLDDGRPTIWAAGGRAGTEI